MKRRIFDVALGLITGAAVMWAFSIAPDRTTVASLSPDDSVRARLVETSPAWGIDRNFSVRLEFLGRDATRTIFSSPDEGRPAGSERFIWSKDGTMLLLVGRHFYTEPGSLLETGEHAYFLYHLPSRRGWCAADQKSGWPRFTNDLLQNIEFTQVVKLRNR